MTVNASAPKQSLFQQVKGFDRVFWLCIFMELMERMAYYGVRLIVPVYLVLGKSVGGPGLTHVEKATVLAAWAAMQSWLPTFAGGFSDRFGYKKTIAVSIFLKTFGYAGMAMATDFWTMVLGTQLLAAGTGLFKPGIQGTMAHSIAKIPGRESMGWGLFYQSVNIGAAISAYVPALTRDMYPEDDPFRWHSVFIACSLIVLSNIMVLFFYEDPKDERASEKDTRSAGRLMIDSFVDLFTSPRLLFYIFISAGFWFAFHQLFDMLPNYVDDWTDSTGIKRYFGELFGIESWIAEANAGQNIPQERLLNINAFMIMFTMFIFAWASSFVRVLTSTILGMLISCLAFGLFVVSADVTVILGGVVLFTVGEMLCSPKRQEYMASLAPPGKRALYLGYANMPDGIGWVLGNLAAGGVYEEKGDKVNLTRKFLEGQDNAIADGAARTWMDGIVALQSKIATLAEAAQAEALKAAGSSAEALKEIGENIAKALKLGADTKLDALLVKAQAAVTGGNEALVAKILPRADVMVYAQKAVPVLPTGTETTANSLRDYLFTTYSPGQVWTIFIIVGLISTVLMVVYDYFVRRSPHKAG